MVLKIVNRGKETFLQTGDYGSNSPIIENRGVIPLAEMISVRSKRDVLWIKPHATVFVSEIKGDVELYLDPLKKRTAITLKGEDTSLNLRLKPNNFIGREELYVLTHILKKDLPKTT